MICELSQSHLSFIVIGTFDFEGPYQALVNLIPTLFGEFKKRYLCSREVGLTELGIQFCF